MKLDLFYAGINNFWVGLFTGLLLPVMILAALLYGAVSQITGLIEEVALAPLIQRSEQTFDKVDSLLMTLDDKVSSTNLKELALLTPLKNAQLLPELQTLASSVEQLKQAGATIDKEALLAQLKSKLEASLASKFPEEKAKQLAQSLVDIALVLASRAQSGAQAAGSAPESASAIVPSAIVPSGAVSESSLSSQ
ncbi:MAG: hypothetical protein ACRDA8_17815 [Shewanella sp.]